MNRSTLIWGVRRREQSNALRVDFIAIYAFFRGQFTAAKVRNDRNKAR